jgi:SAM-dependent methyltransferase
MKNASHRPAWQTLAALSIAGAHLMTTPIVGNAGQDPMFSGAQAYERFMGAWSREVAPLFVRFAGVKDGEAVLDIGSGTGALSAAVLAAAPSGRIVGIDPAAPYVAFAQSRQGSPRVTFETGDAQQMRFADREFDRTLSLLVMNFIPDRDRAMKEMIRVTRPNGIIAAGVWDYGDGMQFLRVFWDEVIAQSPAADAKDERHMPLCRKGELGALWRGHGLLDVEETALTIPTRFTNFADYWSRFLEKQGPAGAYVAAMSESDREQLRLRLQKRLVGAGPDRPIDMTARVWAVKGRVPQK